MALHLPPAVSHLPPAATEPTHLQPIHLSNSSIYSIYPGSSLFARLFASVVLMLQSKSSLVNIFILHLPERKIMLGCVSSYSSLCYLRLPASPSICQSALLVSSPDLHLYIFAVHFHLTVSSVYLSPTFESYFSANLQWQCVCSLALTSYSYRVTSGSETKQDGSGHNAKLEASKNFTEQWMTSRWAHTWTTPTSLTLMTVREDS